MEYVTLTGCGLKVSRMCLGTMTMGDQVDEKGGIEAVDYALDQGVNFFDTANAYTGGKSEEIMGKAMAGRRDRFILATKVGLKVSDDVNGVGLSRFAIMREIENSLRRLKTDYLDFYYLHAPDYNTPVEETLSVMDDLVRSGKVRYIGASNYASWQLCQLCHTADAINKTAPIVSQMVYNLVTRGLDQELIPFVRAYGMGLIVYNPLAGGLLTEKYAAKAAVENTRLASNATYKNRYWNQSNLQAWDDVHTIARKAGITMVELANRWLVSTGNVDAILTGFSSLEQLKQNLASIDGGELPGDVMEACDKVWEKLAGDRFQYNR